MCKRFRWIFVLLMMVLFVSSRLEAQGPSSEAGSVVLTIQDEMRYFRDGWRKPVLVHAGTFLRSEDLIFPNNASLLVLCTDGRLKSFVSGELLPNDKLNCDTSRDSYVISEDSVKTLNVQRGGHEDPSIPYLITPRGTLVRSQTLRLEWNALSNAIEYQLRILGGGEEVLPSTSFLANDITEGGIASTEQELELEPNVSYIVEICVLYQDLHSRCTTDPGWTSTTNIPFYYVPNPQLASRDLQAFEEDIIVLRGENAPETLYAQAVLVSQHFSPYNLGFYSEAIDLLNRLIFEHPESPLARTAEIYMRLGDLYAEVDLPLKAARAYRQAILRGQQCTETLAEAYLGFALTVPNPDSRVDLIDEAIEQYNCLLQPTAFAETYSILCKTIGDECAKLKPLDAFEGQK